MQKLTSVMLVRCLDEKTVYNANCKYIRHQRAKRQIFYHTSVGVKSRMIDEPGINFDVILLGIPKKFNFCRPVFSVVPQWPDTKGAVLRRTYCSIFHDSSIP